MKLGEIVVHMDNYNITKFHQNQMKNKKVLSIAHFSVQNFKVWVESWKSYIVHSLINIPIGWTVFAIRNSKIKVRRRSAIMMKINHSLMIDIRLSESHQRIGQIVSQDQLTKGRSLHNIVGYFIWRSVGVLGKQQGRRNGLWLALYHGHIWLLCDNKKQKNIYYRAKKNF